jgi:hypothetical protein
VAVAETQIQAPAHQNKGFGGAKDGQGDDVFQSQFHKICKLALGISEKLFDLKIFNPN